MAHHKTSIPLGARPLEIEIGKAWWNANVSGKDEDFTKKEESENKLNDSLADTKQFDRLKKIHDGQYVLIPYSDKTHGHFTHYYAEVWKPFLASFMKKLGPVAAARLRPNRD